MRLSFVLLTVAGACAGQTLLRVANAADPGNLLVAPGSLVVVRGASLGPVNAVRAQPPYATTLGPYGVVLRSVATGEESRAYMVSVASSVTVAVLPSSLTEGEYDLLYLNGALRSRPLRFRVVPRSFSLFSVTGDGAGPADAVAGDKPVGFLSPAKPGQIITLTGTGLGPVAGADNQAAEQAVEVELELRIGKAIVKPIYTGRSPTAAGVDQLRFALPAEAEAEIGDGCYVPVRVKINEVFSNLVTIAKMDTADRCPHPLGLSEAALKKVDSGQPLTQGNFWIGATVLDAELDGEITRERVENAGGTFFLGTGNHLLKAAGESGPIGLAPGECSTSTVALSASDIESIDDLLLPILVGSTFQPPAALDGGARALLTAPSGRQALLAPSLTAQSGTLQTILADVEDVRPVAIAPGEWQIQWQGGSQIATGIAKLNVKEADPLSWTQALPPIDAAQELPLTWSTQGLDENSTLYLSGLFLAPVENTIALGSLSCKLAGNATSFTIPEAVMKSLPRTPAGGLALLVLEGRTAVAPFSANYRAVAGQLDYGAFDQRFSVVKLRSYQR